MRFMRSTTAAVFVMRAVVSTAVALLAAPWVAAAPNSPIPAFESTALTGEKVTDAKLIGQPTILIVTPSKAAAEDKRQKANALCESLDPKSIRIRDVLALAVPFFMSEADIIGRAKEKIPKRHHDQTWITSGTQLEKALDVPVASNKAFVLVLDTQGSMVVRVAGEPMAHDSDRCFDA
jgi:hypothetical protein